MRTIEIIAAIIAAVVFMPTNNAHADTRDWRPCYEGDEVGACVWDARHMGNGAGRSYLIQRDGDKMWITHRRAHRLLAR